MFSRIRLRPEDAAYHRFLWAEQDGCVITYQMDRLAFGDKCSPFVAIVTTRQAAADHGEESWSMCMKNHLACSLLHPSWTLTTCFDS